MGRGGKRAGVEASELVLGVEASELVLERNLMLEIEVRERVLEPNLMLEMGATTDVGMEVRERLPRVTFFSHTFLQ